MRFDLQPRPLTEIATFALGHSFIHIYLAAGYEFSEALASPCFHDQLHGFSRGQELYSWQFCTNFTSSVCFPSRYQVTTVIYWAKGSFPFAMFTSLRIASSTAPLASSRAKPVIMSGMALAIVLKMAEGKKHSEICLQTSISLTEHPHTQSLAYDLASDPSARRIGVATVVSAHITIVNMNLTGLGFESLVELVAENLSYG